MPSDIKPETTKIERFWYAICIEHRMKLKLKHKNKKKNKMGAAETYALRQQLFLSIYFSHLKKGRF